MTSIQNATSPSGASATNLDEQDRPFVWIDGELLPKSKAMVSVFDHGLLYGDGVFEGIRVYNGVIFKCQAHLDRIFRNAEQLHMHRQGGSIFGRNADGFPYSKDDIRRVMERCVEANGITDGYIRLVFTRGVGNLGLNPFQCKRPTVICIADEISLYSEAMYKRGMKVIVANRPRTPTVCLDPQLKSLNYLNNILAKVEAIDASPEGAPPEDCILEAIMLAYSEDPSKQVVGECTGDNLFIVKDGQLYTSPLAVPMLDGITRAFIMNELAPSLGMRVIEEPLTLRRVLDADEIFLSGSAAEIIAVRQVDDTAISEGEGPITASLRQGFRAIVTGADIPTD